MRLFTAIISIYSVCYQVETQILFPDDQYLSQVSTVSRPSKDRPSTPVNHVANLNQKELEYDRYVEQLVAKGISNLAISINNFYLHSRNPDNIVFSPVSLAGALALVLLGSNGKTFNEIASAMGLIAGTDISSNSLVVHESLGRLFARLNRQSEMEQIKIAAAIFVQNNFPIRSIYKETSEDIYRSEIVNVDFRNNNAQAQKVINKWVSDKTNGKIRSMLSEPPSRESRVVITSALYFNGAWEKPFWDGFTRKRKFYPNGRKSHTNLEVDMMSNGGHFPYYKDTQLNCDIMGFPYKGNTTMYVIIPQHSSIENLKIFEESLSINDIIRLIENTRYTQSVVLFPKMRLEATYDLSHSLQDLGIISLFDPFEANLALLSSGLVNRQHTKVKEVSRQSAVPIVRRINHNSAPIAQTATESTSRGLNEILLFSRFGSPLNCTQMFNRNSNMSECEEIDGNTQKQVTYKKFGDKLGRRVTRDTDKSLDEVRLSLNKDPQNRNSENPGLYADQVLQKVYIDINEQGTEAAASTSVSLNRGGDINTFRADIPFLFFIWDEKTKLILFWSTVYEPTPNYS